MMQYTCFLYFVFLDCRRRNRCLINKADDEERNNADEPFKVDDVRQNVNSREELPCKQADDADQRCPEGCVFAAQGRAEHGAEKNERKGCCQTQADEHHLDDADGIEGKP